MDISIYMKDNYGKITPCVARKNKANQSQIQTEYGLFAYGVKIATALRASQ
jgi:hypothetical protein